MSTCQPCIPTLLFTQIRVAVSLRTFTVWPVVCTLSRHKPRIEEPLHEPKLLPEISRGDVASELYASW
eukprot:3721144-Pyramimonas_sp.AAC.2